MAKSLQAPNGQGFRAFMDVHDLHLILRTGHAPEVQSLESAHERRKKNVPTGHGFVPCKSSGRMPEHQRVYAGVHALLYRVVSHHGFCPTDRLQALRDIAACLTANQFK